MGLYRFSTKEVNIVEAKTFLAIVLCLVIVGGMVFLRIRKKRK